MCVSIQNKKLVLEAAGSTTPTSLLELAALRAHIWCSTASRSTSGAATMSSPVTCRLASKPRSTEEHTVGSSGEELSELIEGEDLATIVHNAGTSSLRHTQGTELNVLGCFQHANIVGHSADNNSHFPLLATHELGNLRQRKRRTVHLAHKETLQDNFVEV